MIKKTGALKNIEKKIETSMFASRWFMAPVYIVLSISLAIIMLKVIQEFVHNIPIFVSMDMRNLLLFVLHIIDMALIGNLVLMILFSGYENFVSKMESAKDNADKPSWMGKIDFSGLKLKLIASIVAISGINLLESFMDLGTQSDRDLRWQIIIHLVFLVSGVLLALMDYISGKTPNSY